MLFDLQDDFDLANFKVKVDLYIQKKKRVELIYKSERRTLSQNNYLHLILSYFAARYGETKDFVDRVFYREYCNKNIFLVEKEDKILGKTTYLRSSTELTVEEMSDSIERFRNFASKEAGIYIPSSNETNLHFNMQKIIEQNRNQI